MRNLNTGVKNDTRVEVYTQATFVALVIFAKRWGYSS